MGQAFHRASGRIPSTSLDPPSSSSGKKAVDSRPPVTPPEKYAGDNVGPGSASVVESDKRPLPRLRNTTVESGRYEERPVPPGTLNVAQVRHTSSSCIKARLMIASGPWTSSRLPTSSKWMSCISRKSSNPFRCFRRTPVKREMICDDHHWLFSLFALSLSLSLLTNLSVQ
ncbi:uncharacterized protein LOC130775173 isoform X1 [Actinidia eriantha]|uniref:uncharacterized protein LOC130775173 isoform X1 n=1 Tax=Actinidia eriantha TaxID=165200 RepID=UPI00258CF177|nr:uncharacterized protein LOC130775173 isoform X1 [Actinidia eriantha]